MSNISYSIVTPPTSEDAELLSFAFLTHFPDSQGVVFGAFRIPTNAGHIAGVVRERLERWATRPAPKPELLEAAFEQLVATINEECRDTIESEQTLIEPHTLDMAIGAVGGSQLVLTSIGEFRATFLRGASEGTFHVYDLLKGLRSEVVGADKLFASLVAGEVQIDDTIALALPETVKELGAPAWKQALATMEPGEARAHFLRTIEVSPETGPVLVMRVTKERIATPPKEARGGTAGSIEALRRTEQTTSALLRGRGLPSSHATKQLLLRAGALGISAARWIHERVRGASVQSVLRAPAHLARTLPAIARAPRTLLRGTGSHRPLWHELPQALGRIRDSLLNRFNSLSRTAKLLFVLIIVVVVLFIQSIIYLQYRKNVVAEREVHGTLVAEIRRLQDDADASIIYRDEEGARALLLAAREQTNALPNKSRKDRGVQTELLSEIEAALVTLRHEVRVEPQEATPSGFDDWLLLYEQSTLENPITSITAAEGRVVARYADGSLGMLSGTSFAPLAVNLPAESVTDAELFGDRLYVFVNATPQVYRLRRQGDGFGSAAPWITEGGSALLDVQSMGIDGAIYFLRANEVLKFFTGVHELEWQPHIDPPLEGATKIWTSDEAAGIYILEPSKRRIVVLDKPGALVAQYLFPEGTDLRDFAVNEAEKVLSVLDGSTLKRVPLSP